MHVLPQWERGTPAVLCVAGPHAIPISTPVRAGDTRVHFALGVGRETLKRLREDPAVALCMLGRGLAFSAYGEAHVVRESLEVAEGIAAVALDVERVQDHLADGRTEMVDGARWRWLDERAAATDPRVDAELRALAP